MVGDFMGHNEGHHVVVFAELKKLPCDVNVAAGKRECRRAIEPRHHDFKIANQRR